MCLYYITNQNYFSNIFNVGDFLTLTVILRLCWWLMLHLLHVCMYVYGTKYNLLIIAFSNLLSTDKHVVKKIKPPLLCYHNIASPHVFVEVPTSLQTMYVAP